MINLKNIYLILVFFALLLPVSSKFVATNKIQAIGNLELQLNDTNQIVSLKSNGGRPIVSMNINNIKELLTGRNNYMKIEVFKVIEGSLNFVGSFTYSLSSKKSSKTITVPLPEFVNQSETYQFHIYDTNGNLNSKFSYSFSADDLVNEDIKVDGLNPDGLDPNVTKDLFETVLRNISVRSISSAKIPSIEKYGESFVLNIPDGIRSAGASKASTTSVLKVNAFGKLSDRDKYNNSKSGFVFLDNETKQAYVKGKGVGTWSNPIPFTNSGGSSDSTPIDFEKINDEIIPLTKVQGAEDLSLEVEDILKDLKEVNADLLETGDKVKLFDSQISSANSKATEALNKVQDASSKAQTASSLAQDASSKAQSASTLAQDASSKAQTASNQAQDASLKAQDATNKANQLNSQVTSINTILPTKLNSDFSNLSGDLNISGKIKTANTADKTISLSLDQAIRESGTLFGKVSSNTVPVIRFANTGSSATWTVSLPKDLVKDLTNNNKFKFKLIWSPNNSLAEKVNWELQYFSYNIGDTVSPNQGFTLNKLATAPAQDLGLSFTEFEVPTKDFKDFLVIKLTRKDSNNIQPNLMAFEINYPALSLEKL
jgi:hypothetical protein